jgi:hypothetical protein
MGWGDSFSRMRSNTAMMALIGPFGRKTGLEKKRRRRVYAINPGLGYGILYGIWPPLTVALDPFLLRRANKRSALKSSLVAIFLDKLYSLS